MASHVDRYISDRCRTAGIAGGSRKVAVAYRPSVLQTPMRPKPAFTFDWTFMMISYE